MTITDDEIQELRRLYTVARDTVSTTAYQRDVALRKTSDLMVWNGFDGGDGILPGILDEVLRLRSENKAVLCRGCGGTIGDHLAPDQGGCPGDFRIDGVSVAPVAARDAEIARLRAENERLRNQRCACCGEIPIDLTNLPRRRPRFAFQDNSENERLRALPTKPDRRDRGHAFMTHDGMPSSTCARCGLYYKAALLECAMKDSEDDCA